MDNFEPVSVSGAVYTKFGNRGLGEGGWGKSDVEEKKFDVDDLAGAFIKLEDGATVILKASWARHQGEANKQDVELFGTEGGAQVFPPRLFRFSKVPGEYEIVETQNVAKRHPALDRMVNWLDAILGRDDLECKPEQSLAVQKIIDAVYESSQTGREVRI
jgi:predicted dehydrogenase